MAKGLIHGENGDMLQMETVFLIKLLSRFSWFELFHLAQWKRAFPLVLRAALVCKAESTVLAGKIWIINTASIGKVNKIHGIQWKNPWKNSNGYPLEMHSPFQNSHAGSRGSLCPVTQGDSPVGLYTDPCSIQTRLRRRLLQDLSRCVGLAFVQGPLRMEKFN